MPKLDEQEVTEEKLQEAKTSTGPDKKIVEIAPGVFKTVSRLRD